MKGKIAAIANYDDLNYVKIKTTNSIIDLFCDFLSEIGIKHTWFFEEVYDEVTGKMKPFVYDEHTDEHTLFENEDFKVHTVFSKSYVHLFILTKNREKLNKALSKFFEFVKAG